MSRRPPPASSFYGGRDQYGGGAYGGRAMGFGDYSRMQSEFWSMCVSNSVSLVCVSTKWIILWSRVLPKVEGEWLESTRH